jgi:hypothetical protein
MIMPAWMLNAFVLPSENSLHSAGYLQALQWSEEVGELE